MYRTLGEEGTSYGEDSLRHIKAFEKSSAWRMDTGIAPRLPTVSVVGG